MNTTNHSSPSGEELKPCPFCGGAAELQEYEEVDATRWAALVRCTVCGVDGKRGYANNRMGCFDAVNGLHMQSAIAAWNRRAQHIGEDAANGAIGEREAFEALMRMRGEDYLYRRDEPGCERRGDYCRQSVQDQWEVWQARANLGAAK
jgi:Lar family restriction alleviation protein